MYLLLCFRFGASPPTPLSSNIGIFWSEAQDWTILYFENESPSYWSPLQCSLFLALVYRHYAVSPSAVSSTRMIFIKTIAGFLLAENISLFKTSHRCFKMSHCCFKTSHRHFKLLILSLPPIEVSIRFCCFLYFYFLIFSMLNCSPFFLFQLKPRASFPHGGVFFFDD